MGLSCSFEPVRRQSIQALHIYILTYRDGFRRTLTQCEADSFLPQD
jgi:hypothetical protein